MRAARSSRFTESWVFARPNRLYSAPYSSPWPHSPKRRPSSRRLRSRSGKRSCLLASARIAPPCRAHLGWIAALLAPRPPTVAWYAYHDHRTGFVFGNPEYLRYNATANLDAHRIALGLYHRFLHLTMHMNMFVPVTCAVAALLMPAARQPRARLSRPVLSAIAVVLLANWIAFSVLGGALLTRYLLPMYPLVLLVCVGRVAAPPALLGLARRAQRRGRFLCGIWINPPYSFAPEDNLTYRDMIVLHQRAIANVIAQRSGRRQPC
jgi:hypothetical protein